MKRAFFALVACAALIACGDDPVSNPYRVQAPVQPPPTPSYVLFGTVRDDNGVGIPGATAEIDLGLFAGRTATSNADGHFSFVGVSGSMRVRVYKDGYDLYVQSLTLAGDLALSVRLIKLIPADTITLGQTIRSTVSTGDVPCDRIRWDARAPCRRFRFTAPKSGTLVITISWTGAPELDATLVNLQDQYVATSQGAGVDQVELAAFVEARRTYEIRVNSYYTSQVFSLKAVLE